MKASGRNVAHINPNSFRIAGSVDSTIRLWDLETRQTLRTIHAKGPVTKILVLPKSHLLQDGRAAHHAGVLPLPLLCHCLLTASSHPSTDIQEKGYLQRTHNARTDQKKIVVPLGYQMKDLVWMALCVSTAEASA